jgi:hypothetical protein
MNPRKNRQAENAASLFSPGDRPRRGICIARVGASPARQEDDEQLLLVHE